MVSVYTFQRYTALSKIIFGTGTKMAASSLHLRKVVSKAYQTYRNTRVALALFDTIKELLRDGVLTPEQAKILVFQFDYSFRKELQSAMNVGCSNFVFEAESVKAYRKFNSTYQIVLEKVSFSQDFTAQTVAAILDQGSLKFRKPAKKKVIDEWKNITEKYNVTVPHEKLSRIVIMASASEFESK